jgi:hypothetical protein
MRTPISLLETTSKNMSSKTNLRDLLSSRLAPIQDTLMSVLEVADIIALRQTCKAVCAEITDKLEMQDYNINLTLKRWFIDPIAFRSTQAACNALILGRLPFHFMSRRKSQHDVLHIACGEQIESMEGFLEADGYVKCLDSDAEEDEKTSLEFKQYRSNENGACEYIMSLYEKVTDNGETSAILVYNDPTPVSTLISNTARTTADLHVISWNKAYSLYPRCTMLTKEAFLLNMMNEEICEELSEDINSLSEDGIAAKGVHWSSMHDPSNVPEELTSRLRRIGDKFTWTINLNTEGISPTSCVPDNVLQSSTFRIALPFRSSPFEMPVSYYTMMVRSLTAPTIKYSYTYATSHDKDQYNREHNFMEYSNSISWLNLRIHEATMVEITKMKTQDRPAIYAQIFALGVNISSVDWNAVDIQKPATWKHYDDELLKQLHAVWMARVERDDKEAAR